MSAGGSKISRDVWVSFLQFMKEAQGFRAFDQSEREIKERYSYLTGQLFEGHITKEVFIQSLKKLDSGYLYRQKFSVASLNELIPLIYQATCDKQHVINMHRRLKREADYICKFLPKIGEKLPAIYYNIFVSSEGYIYPILGLRTETDELLSTNRDSEIRLIQRWSQSTCQKFYYHARFVLYPTIYFELKPAHFKRLEQLLAKV